VNENSYKIPKTYMEGPHVGICLSGTSQAHIDGALHNMPNWSRVISSAGFRLPSELHDDQGKGMLCGPVAGIVPSNTYPNNASIITGTNIDSHKVLFPSDTPQSDSVLAALQHSGCSILLSTPETNIRNLVSHQLSLVDTTIPKLSDPSDDLSPLTDAVHLLKDNPKKYDISYICLSDRFQHKYSELCEESAEFYGRLDLLLGELSKLNCTFAVTSDHGMNEKTNYNGQPRSINIQKILESIGVDFTVSFPIRDGEECHSLGSTALIKLQDFNDREKALKTLRDTPGLYTALGKEDFCRGLDLPQSLDADILVVGDQYSVFASEDGSFPAHSYPFRSHGSFEEQVVPFLMQSPSPLCTEYRTRLSKGKVRNYHLFDYLLNAEH